MRSCPRPRSPSGLETKRPARPGRDRGEAVGSVGRRTGPIGPRITRRRLESVPDSLDSLTPEEVELMWETASPRMPIAKPRLDGWG